MYDPVQPLVWEPAEKAAYRGPANWPKVVVVEEGMREGLQIESPDITVDRRLELLRALNETGLKRIIVGSFVSPKWVPQMKDIDELLSKFTPREGVYYSALSVNTKGVERAAGYVDILNYLAPPGSLIHVCDVFAQRNTNRGRDGEIEAMHQAIATASLGSGRYAQVAVNAAWGSNWVGRFSPEQRWELLDFQAREWRQAGFEVGSVFLGDPMGWNSPNAVAEDIEYVLKNYPTVGQFHLHLHNTRGLAAISLYKAMELLNERYTLIADTSIGGMAGCPYCGNGRAAQLTPTEDFIGLLENIGYDTGVDLIKLADVAALAEDVVGHPLYGHVSKSGPPPTDQEHFYPLDMPFVQTVEQAQHFRLGPETYENCLAPWKEPVNRSVHY